MMKDKKKGICDRVVTGFEITKKGYKSLFVMVLK